MTNKMSDPFEGITVGADFYIPFTCDMPIKRMLNEELK